MDKLQPFNGLSQTQISQEVFQMLLIADINDTFSMEGDLRTGYGKSLQELAEIIAARFANWAASTTQVEDIAPITLLANVTQSMETFLPMEEGKIIPVKTALLMQLPEFIVAVLAPFENLHPLAPEAVRLAQDALWAMFSSMGDEHTKILLEKYPSALTRATQHAARALERLAIRNQAGINGEE